MKEMYCQGSKQAREAKTLDESGSSAIVMPNMVIALSASAERSRFSFLGAMLGTEIGRVSLSAYLCVSVSPSVALSLPLPSLSVCMCECERARGRERDVGSVARDR